VLPLGTLTRVIIGSSPGSCDEERPVDPVCGIGSSLKLALDRADDRAELAMVYAHHNGAPCVMSSRLGPAAGNEREVLDVERDEYSLFLPREREQLFVARSVEFALFVCGSDVVASIAKLDGNSPSRDVSVEKKLHGSVRSAQMSIRLTSMKGNSSSSCSIGRRFSVIAASISSGNRL